MLIGLTHLSFGSLRRFSFASPSALKHELVDGLRTLVRCGDLRRALSLFYSAPVELQSQQAYAALFQACADQSNLRHGIDLHHHMLSHPHSYSQNLVLANYLITMYAKCGNILNARQVFDKMPERNVVSWTALITGYAQAGIEQEGFWLFSAMLAHCCPNEFALSNVLTSCRYESGKQIHGLALKLGLHYSIYVANALISMYGRCRYGTAAYEAWTLFEAMEFKNLVTWNSMIAAFQCGNLGKQAIDLFIRMHSDGVGFDRLHSSSSSAVSGDLFLHSAASLLSACVDARAFLPGLQIHAHCVSSGVEYHSALVPKLVTFYSAFNLHSKAQSINENSYILHPLPWNVLIASYAKNELFEEAVAAHKKMVSKGIRPDAFTYPSVLKACGETLDFASGRVVHGSIEVSAYKSSLYVCNALISMYKRFGNVGSARRLFDRMSERDAVSWNAVISCYASEGMWSEAFELFDKMWFSGVEVSVITWNIVSGGCLHTGNYAGALGLVSRMRSFPTSLDPVAVIIGLKACSLLGAIRLGKEIHSFAIRNFYDGIDNVRNTLITMYSKCDDLRCAFIVFQQIEEKSLSTWNSIISGYAQVNRSEEASYLLREMLLAGFQPNSITLASILPLCARVANLQHGKEFHCYILRRKCFNDYTMLWNSLVDVYAKSGKIVAAKRVSDLMSVRDEVTYTSLIDGYGNQGEGRVAVALFKEMIRSGIKPDHVTMVAVLSACSHSMLVHEGQKLFMKMECEYGIGPCLQHFSCMVDLYGRAGHLAKARDVIHRMPYEPSGAIWATLLNACHIHGNTYIGEWAAEKLLEMKPENPGYYVLIANMYAAAGSWSKLAEVRTFMRGLGVKKDPGCAWIDTDSGFSLFSVGDTSTPQACHTYPLLDGLNQLMKDAAGYAIKEEQSSDEELLQEIG